MRFAVQDIDPNDFKKGEVEKLTFLDVGSTIKSSGLYGNASAFIPTLTFLSGPALGKEIPLIHDQIILGRGADCDIVIPDPSISRKHLQICCRKMVKNGANPTIKVVLRDLGSSNGTLVNYSAIRRAVLNPGDKIFIGHVILKFDHRDIAEQNFYDEIYRMATTDSLTALLNKAAIARCLSEEIAGGMRKHRRISVMLIDVDGFKGMNGDRILQTAASIFQGNLRKRDRVGRFGGDEFLIVLPETGANGALQLAERLRLGLETSVAASLGLSTNVTASFGVASACANQTTPEDILEQADRALYRAKALGKNRAEIWKAPRLSERGL
jgi:two-component system cell cycle response regulator